ncbi:MAG: amidohydrolase family protein [Candidatus Bathyarchaeia archaeon]
MSDLVFVLSGATVIDGTGKGPEKDLCVEVRNGRISGIFSSEDCPKGRMEIDLGGAFLLPGLIDAHVHLDWDGGKDPLSTMLREGPMQALLRSYANSMRALKSGITSLRDLGSVEDVVIELSKAIREGKLFGPTVVASGRMLNITGGHVPAISYIADGIDQVIRAVRHMKMVGAQVIKCAATGGAYGPEEIGPPTYTLEELRAIADEAHRLGLPVAAHALSAAGVDNCVKAGIDTIEHGASLSDYAIDEMLKRGIIWVPTLYVYRRLAEGEGEVSDWVVEKSKTVVKWQTESFRKALKAGIKMAAGTDSWSPTVGRNPILVEELIERVRAGISPMQAIMSATKVAAEALRMDGEVGTIEVGKRADLLAVDADPTANVANLSKVRLVVKSGKVLYDSRGIDVISPWIGE